MIIKRILLICTCVLLSLGAVAAPQQKRNAAAKARSGQNSDVHREAMEYKLRYLSKRMELTADQQERFAEVYRRMSAEKGKVFREMGRAERAVRQNKEATDKDYEAFNDKMEALGKQDAEIDARYDKEFRTFISAKQLYQMKKAERDFMDRLREMYNRKADGAKKHEKKRDSSSPGLPDADSCAESCQPLLIL